ncbi:heparin lyase I family protein [Kibdelosporangium lantanae]|uniref:Heparin lyase I family protein n=1 Tax=Kibdelosporangium lantanae TaxID=1497396 RepID=A0ABW3MBS2_9PSEU
MEITRRRVLLGSTAAAFVPVLGAATAAADVTPQSIIWDGDPARGTSVFDGLERDPGSITVANDPQDSFGRCFRYQTQDWSNGKERCESRGLRNPDGSVLRLDSSYEGRTLYMGWRALWNVNPNNAWIAVYQLRISGESSGQAQSGPFVLRTVGDGMLHFQLTSPGGATEHIWSTKFPVNQWNRIVVGMRVSRGGDGWVEFWWNGVQQKFSNGQTRYPGATLWGSHINHKWGVYRSGSNSGTSVAFLNRARLGNSLADVAL